MEAKQLLNDDCSLLETSTYCFNSVEIKSLSSGSSQVKIKNEVTRKIGIIALF